MADSYYERLAQLAAGNVSPIDVRRHITQGPCCVLGAAIQTASAVDGAVTLLQKLKSTPPEMQIVPPLQARIGLLQAYHNPQSTADQLEAAIQAVIEQTATDWNFSPTPEMQALNRSLAATGQTLASSHPQPAQPASFVHALSAGGASGQSGRPNPQLVELLQAAAGQATGGWTHPGLQLAGCTLAALATHRLPEPEYQIKTVVMFVGKHPTHPFGVVAQLTMRRLPHGCGLLLPDPLHGGGYLWMSDTTFSTGLQNALHAARGYIQKQTWNAGRLDYDWMWSLDLLHSRANLPKELELWPRIPIQGRSAEVALTCAMIATAKGNPDAQSSTLPLDPHVGATASLDTKAAGWNNGDLANLQLNRVDAITDKTILGRMESTRLSTIIVSADQPDGSLPTDNRYEFCRVPTLQAAYEAMVRMPRISRAVNRAIARHAKALLQENCQPYIEPALAWDPRPEDLQQSSPDGSQPKLTPLTETQFRQICTGQLEYRVGGSGSLPDPEVETQGDDPAEETTADTDRLVGNRIWVCAESGLGKSMFILHCQQTIAESDSGLVPIRLGRTSDQDFALSAQSWENLTPEKLVKDSSIIRFLHEAYPPRTAKQMSDAESLEWLTWLWKNGRLVFLLDALDQTDGRMEGLAKFLQNDSARLCSAIMTGRPESRINQAEAFRGDMVWNDLRLLPFDRPRQVKYLGQELADRLLPEQEQIDWETSTDADELRRHHWKDLLEVPLMLSLLRTLAQAHGANGLEGITSKYDLYDKAVEYLIDQASGKIEDQSLSKKIEGDERDLLEEIAWLMMQASHTTNQVVGKSLTTLRKNLKTNHQDADLLDIIARINIATLFQILEPSTSTLPNQKKVEALAFRHRSFLEFFAGCYFARRLGKDDQDSKLVDIHKMLDDCGEIRVELLPNQDRPANWQETLRFALSAANPETRNRLAKRLIELGNPWVVYQSLLRDHVAYSAELSAVVRWLVHRDFNFKYNYTMALSSSVAASQGSAPVNEYQQSQFDTATLTSLATRDAGYLSPLRELVGDLRVNIGTSAASSLLERMTRLRGGPPASPTWSFLESFVRVAGGKFNIGQYHTQFTGQTVDIPDFGLADFPVTNELYELFCPTHRRWRDQYSLEDDQPVVHVNWYMATEFCHWLSALTGQHYRLPTEWEWEWACRWLCDPKTSPYASYDHWWGPQMNDQLCWYGGIGDGPAKELKRTRGRAEALVAFNSAALTGVKHPSWQSAARPGLLDQLGNVWEWCENGYDQRALHRVLRGGSWFDLGVDCRSGYRSGYAPSGRYGDLGFRLAAVLVSPQDPGSQSRSTR